MSIRSLQSRIRLALVATFAATPPAMADLLYFKRGGAVQLPCRREGSKVVVESPTGPIEFEAGDFRRIVPGGDPVAEWPTRLSSSRPKGSDAILAAAWWALENGLTPEAISALRDLHAADPHHEPTAGLIRMLGLVSPPLPSPDLADLTTTLGGTFSTAESPHFVLLHQGAEHEASARLDVLERVYLSFYLSFAGQGIELQRPQKKLAAAVFGKQADYLAFLTREDAGAFASTQGYYHPTRKVVISFDPRDLPSLRRRAAAIASVRDHSRLSLLIDLERRAIDLGVAAHEATHQLVAASGLAPRHDVFPTWLHEGIAGQFEVIRGGRWAGVGRANDLRLPDWRGLRPAPTLAAIVRDEGFNQGYRRDLYAAAWSLVFFLRKTRPRAFADYLDLLRATPSEPRTAHQAIELFRTSFGADLSSLEVEWVRYLRNITTPLETPAIEATRFLQTPD